jgi:hypothetical protein
MPVIVVFMGWIIALSGGENKELLRLLIGMPKQSFPALVQSLRVDPKVWEPPS